MLGEGKGLVKPPSIEESGMKIPHDTDLAIDPHVAQWFVRTVTVLFGMYAIFVGGQIYIGGEQRWAGVSYQVALHTPGAPWTWAVTIAISGVLILVGAIIGRPRWVALGGLIGSIWGWLFAVSFFITMLQYPEANNTAFPAYAGIAVMFALIGGVNLVMDPPKWLRRLARHLPNRKG